MSSMSIFAPANAFVLAAADQAEERGYSCHLMTVSVGWVESRSSKVVLATDSEVGETALGELALNEAMPATDVLIVANSAATESTQAMWRALTDACRERHRVTSAWCPPLGVMGQDAVSYAEAVMGRFLDERDVGDITVELTP